MRKAYNLAVAAMAALLASPSTVVLAGSVQGNDSQTDSTPLADRAATLGGQTFKVERLPADGARLVSRQGIGSADSASGNPLADRAATLGGKVFTVEGANDVHYASSAGNDAETYRAFGTPLKDRAEILGGKIVTVEHTQSSPRVTSFLARF